MMGRAEVLKVLLATGANANAPDDVMHRPLHFAADQGHARAVHVLLAAGADSAEVNGFGSRPTDKTPVKSWDSAETARGKVEIARMFGGEQLEYEELRAEPLAKRHICASKQEVAAEQPPTSLPVLMGRTHLQTESEKADTREGSRKSRHEAGNYLV